MEQRVWADKESLNFSEFAEEALYCFLCEFRNIMSATNPAS